MTSAKRRRHKGIGLITPAPSCQALVQGSRLPGGMVILFLLDGMIFRNVWMGYFILIMDGVTFVFFSETHQNVFAVQFLRPKMAFCHPNVEVHDLQCVNGTSSGEIQCSEMMESFICPWLLPQGRMNCSECQGVKPKRCETFLLPAFSKQVQPVVFCGPWPSGKKLDPKPVKCWTYQIITTS